MIFNSSYNKLGFGPKDIHCGTVVEEKVLGYCIYYVPLNNRKLRSCILLKSESKYAGK
jgi:hypothetical protein